MGTSRKEAQVLKGEKRVNSFNVVSNGQMWANSAGCKTLDCTLLVIG